MSNWAETAGTWLCYRAGSLDLLRGVFFADSYDSAWLYSVSSGKPVQMYEVTLTGRVLVEANQYEIVARQRKMTVEELRQDISRSRDPHWMRNTDLAIVTAARKAGYQAIVYTRPTTPNADRELVVLDRKCCRSLGEYSPPAAPKP